MSTRDFDPARDLFLQLDVATAAAGYDFTTQERLAGTGPYVLPRFFLITGGGTLTFLDASGTSRTVNVGAGRAYPATIAAVTGATGSGFVQFFVHKPDPDVGSASDLTSLDTRVSTESSTRSSADTSLTTRISTEESTSTSADTSLTTRVSSEESTSASADTSLTTRVSTEESTSASAAASLTTRVSTEESTRASEDTSLETRVSTEESTSASADTSIDTRVSTLESRTDVLATRSVPLSLYDFREVDASGDVGDAVANGGLLASDTTPILRGNAAETQEISWATGNTDIIAAQTSLPSDFSGASDVTVVLWVYSGDTNPATFTVETGWDGGALVSDTATDGTPSGTIKMITATIAAADVPDSAAFVTIMLTPAAHATDAIQIVAARLNYSSTAA